jgi:hypothetical protein
VVVSSAAALICDTGALLDYLVESAPDHALFRSAIDHARTRYVPGLGAGRARLLPSRRAAGNGQSSIGRRTLKKPYVA